MKNKKSISKFTSLILVLCMIFSMSTFEVVANNAVEGYVSAYISDMEWDSYTSLIDGSGLLLFRDSTLGGAQISIGGVIYNKGIVMHPLNDGYAEVVVDIDGKGYNQFHSVVGKEDSAGGGTNQYVKFMVLLDGQVADQSPLLTLDDSYEFNVDITGASTLTLRVTDGGDGYANDLSAWGDAAVTTYRAFVSDMAWESYSSLTDGSGLLLFRDSTLGGGQISIDGVTYDKGIVMHPLNNGYADVVINVEGQGYTRFRSVVGKEDSAGGGTDQYVKFVVLLDGEAAAESPLMTLGESYVFDVDITGASTLTLMVSDGGDGYANDLSAWGNAALYAYRAYVSDITWDSFTTLGNLIFKDENSTGAPISIGGVTYDKGIVMHPLNNGYAEVVVDIEGQGYTRFRSIVGKEDSAGGGTTQFVQFMVLLDGEAAAESPLMTLGESYAFDVNISGASTLTLRVTDGGDSYSYDMSAWGNAAIYANGAYISDMAWDSSTTLGNILFRDTTASGGHISIGGIAYQKGIVMHPLNNGYAEVVIDIAGKGYTRFRSVVGKDDSAGGGTNKYVQFMVLLDGQVAAQSPLLTLGDSYDFDIDITRAATLTLRVTDGGDGYSFDTSAWGNAEIYEYQAFVSDMDWESYTSLTDGSGLLLFRDGISGGGQISIGGTTYDKGIVMHPLDNGYAEVVADIEGKGYTRFRSVVGKDDSTGGGTDKYVQFMVLLDGEVAAQSPLLTLGGSYTFDVDITGASTLTLRVTDGGDSYAYDMSAWGNASVYTEKPVISSRICSYISDLEWNNYKALADGSGMILIRDSTIGGGQINIGGTLYPKGIVMHPFQNDCAELTVDIAGLGYTQFCADVGKDSTTSTVPNAHVQFFVLLDGIVAAQSPIMAYGDSYSFDVDITDASTLTLRVTNGGDGYSSDTSAWGNAAIYGDDLSVKQLYITKPAGDAPVYWDGEMNVTGKARKSSWVMLTLNSQNPVMIYANSSGNWSYTYHNLSGTVVLDAYAMYKSEVIDTATKTITSKTSLTAQEIAQLIQGNIQKSSEISQAEMTSVSQWITSMLGGFATGDVSIAPFSFMYGGMSSFQWLSQAQYQVVSDTQLDTYRQVVCQWSDNTLKVKVTFKIYDDYPSVEWLMEFENISTTTNTQKISNIITFSTDMEKHQVGTYYTVYAANGGRYKPDDLFPVTRVVQEGESLGLTSGGAGYSSNDDLPFFTVASSEGYGINIAIGWSGGWDANMETTSSGLQLTVKHTDANFFLYPEESVRVQRVLVTQWQGGVIHGQNVATQLLANEYMNKNSNGETPLPEVTVNSCFTGGGGGTRLHISEEEIDSIIDKLIQAGIEGFVIDAGYYDCTVWSDTLGSYELSAERYPDDLQMIKSKFQQAGVDFGFWMPVELMSSNVAFAQAHPELVDGGRFRLETEEARDYILSVINQFADDYGMTFYRQDLGPNYFNETADRQGITEIKHITGLYALQEAILDNFPDMIMEGCCNGGRRIDLETISHFYWNQQSDYMLEAEVNQLSTLGATSFLPGGYINMPVVAYDDYTVWSSFGGQLCLGWSEEDAGWDINNVQRQINLYKETREYLRGDFYPLTDGVDAQGWLAYQHAAADGSGGFAQFFRRSESSPAGDAQRSFCLESIREDELYNVKYASNGTVVQMMGAQLINSLTIICPSPRTAEIIIYSLVRAEEDVFDVSFCDTDGSILQTATAYKGDKIVRPTDLTAKENYTLEGWFKDKALTIEWDFDKDVVNSDVTLYAMWTLNQTAREEPPNTSDVPITIWIVIICSAWAILIYANKKRGYISF